MHTLLHDRMQDPVMVMLAPPDVKLTGMEERRINLLTRHGAPENGPDADLGCQALLGDAMRVLPDFAVVTEEREITRGAVGTVGDPILAPGRGR